MGFPDWTLWGMGLSLGGALLALTLALLGQSPGFLKRAGISGARLQQHVRTYTGYALALVLLACGFFVAGVPLDQGTVQQSADQGSQDLASDQASAGEISSMPETSQEEETNTVTPTRATPETGAFRGPPQTSSPSPTAPTEPETGTSSGSVELEEVVPPQADATETGSPTALPPTATPTPLPTPTPSPTMTPTPILNETAVVDTGGSTIWLLRSPGGQNLVTIADREVVILLLRHANEGGQLWRQVQTVEGVRGWIQEQFLQYDA